MLSKKRTGCLVILLLIATQVDDGWALAPVPPSTSAAADDDEYLPLDSQQREERVVAHERPALPGVKADNAGQSEPILSNLPCAGPFRRSCLYVFLSLRR
jgi:hypothetical protein